MKRRIGPVCPVSGASMVFVLALIGLFRQFQCEIRIIPVRWTPSPGPVGEKIRSRRRGDAPTGSQNKNRLLKITKRSLA